MPKYITTPVLEYYDEKVKEYIANADKESLKQAKSYVDELSSLLNEKIDTIEDNIASLDKKINKAVNSFERIKYEISNTPKGTQIDYRDKEIRVMCPNNTEWVKQTVGATGNANMYYMAFKAYAPEGAVSFKEGDRGVIIDEMFTFDDEFAGTDTFGRNYSICWLALASYDESTDTWTYFGKNSSASKYIGWTYCVEWYDSDGVIIESDTVRINLSNEECHHLIEPYYLNDVVEELKTYTDSQIEEKVEEVSIGVYEF